MGEQNLIGLLSALHTFWHIKHRNLVIPIMFSHQRERELHHQNSKQSFLRYVILLTWQWNRRYISRLRLHFRCIKISFLFQITSRVEVLLPNRSKIQVILNIENEKIWKRSLHKMWLHNGRLCITLNTQTHKTLANNAELKKRKTMFMLHRIQIEQ